MFRVGDKVVYPMHGAGIIEAIEEREVLGETQKYYVMHMPVGNLKVFIPLDSVDNLGIRQIISTEEIPQVMKILQTKDDDQDTMAWSRRYRVNLERMRSGDIMEVAEVVRSLSHRDRVKGLSTGEKKMLENAYQILISELVLAEEKDELEIRGRIDRILA